MLRRELIGGLAAAGLAGQAGAAARQDDPGFRQAADFSAESGGTAVVVRQDGRTLFERYDNGGGPDVRSTIASGTKSFWGPVACLLIQEGLVSGFDELAALTLTEWRDHPRKSRITLRHILSLSSGLDNDLPALQGNGSARNKFRHALGVAATAEPGAEYIYGPVNYYVFGEIVRRKLAGRYRDPLAYLDARLLRPLGIRGYTWVRDPSGNPHMPNGAYITARDWTRFGDFLLAEGVWRGRRLVRAELMRELWRPSQANPGYGMTFWLNRPARTSAQVAGGSRGQFFPGGHPDLFAAVGAGPNMLYIVPSRKAVIVRRRPHQERDAGTPVEQLDTTFRQQTGNFRNPMFLRPILGALA